MVVDPFLKPNNPIAVHTADEVEATHVLLTHGHADHIADAAGAVQAHRRAGGGDRRDRGLAWRTRA